MGRIAAGAREAVVNKTSRSTKIWSPAPMVLTGGARFVLRW